MIRYSKQLIPLFLLIFVQASFISAVPSEAQGQTRFGALNTGNQFVKNLSKKFQLSESLRKMTVKTRKGPVTLTYQEFINQKSHLMVWFQKDGTRPLGQTINDIMILAASKKEVLEVARYFLNSLRADKKFLMRWHDNLNKITFSDKPILYHEFAGMVPAMRCTTHRMYRNDPKNKVQKWAVFYLEINIVE